MSEQPLDFIAEVFRLDDAELAELFGLKLAELLRWRTDGVPAAEADRVDATLALARLLDKRLIPGEAHRVAGRTTKRDPESLLDSVTTGRHHEALARAERWFEYSSAA